MRIAVFGAGGHGKVVWDILRVSGTEVVGFVDDAKAGSFLFGLPIAASPELLPSHDGIIVAIGNNHVRREKFLTLLAAGCTIVNALHPSATIADSVILGTGVVVAPGAIINVDSRIGDNVIVNTGASIDHDSNVGPHAHIAPRVAIGGNVSVDEGSFVGIGACVIPGRRIGPWATIGAGAVVIHDILSNQTAVGVPAKPL